MNPQEQNKEKAPYASATAPAPGVQKNESPKQPAAPLSPADASVKPMDKDAGECGTTKGSCGTK